MSLMSKIEERILKNSKFDYMDSLDIVTKRLAGETECNPPNGIFKSTNINGCEVFAFGNRQKSDRTIIYVHGGAFLHEINYQHLIYCYLLAHRLNAYVIARYILWLRPIASRKILKLSKVCTGSSWMTILFLWEILQEEVLCFHSASI